MSEAMTTGMMDPEDVVGTCATGQSAHAYRWAGSHPDRHPVAACNGARVCIAEVQHLDREYLRCRRRECFGERS